MKEEMEKALAKIKRVGVNSPSSIAREAYEHASQILEGAIIQAEVNRKVALKALEQKGRRNVLAEAYGKSVDMTMMLKGLLME